jgi:hypothetical protein
LLGKQKKEKEKEKGNNKIHKKVGINTDKIFGVNVSSLG